jgi:hypothetical protein
MGTEKALSTGKMKILEAIVDAAWFFHFFIHNRKTMRAFRKPIFFSDLI